MLLLMMMISPPLLLMMMIMSLLLLLLLSVMEDAQGEGIAAASEGVTLLLSAGAGYAFGYYGVYVAHSCDVWLVTHGVMHACCTRLSCLPPAGAQGMGYSDEFMRNVCGLIGCM